MKMSNDTYDNLNKFHRTVLAIAELISLALLIVSTLSDNGVVIPAICTTILRVAQVVIGRLLTISSENYWKEQGGEE